MMGMNTPMLEENAKILAARFPIVLDRILQTGNRLSDNFFFEGEGRNSILMQQRGENAFPVYGSRDKAKLIKRWFDGLQLDSESLYAVTGFGDGSHIKHFLENSSTGSFCLAAEKDPCLLHDTFARIDCSEILKHERFGIGVGELDDQFYIDIQNAAISAITDVNAAVFSPLHAVDEGYYDRMRNELVRQYLVVRPLMEVNVRTATNIQQNSFANLIHMATSPDVGELKNAFQDVPFILVGAGPSLDESIDFLKKVQNKAIIVASNSPYRKLINNGIRPHLVVTADPMKPTLAGFQNVKLDHVPLACPFSAYPEIVKRFSGRILSWSTLNPIADFVKKRIGKAEGTKILEQGTVSGCVLDLSKLFGCKKVIFVGQDMSVKDDGQYYTNDSFYADAGNHFLDTKKGHKLPGNTKDLVHVSRLFVYLKTFQNFVKENLKLSTGILHELEKSKEFHISTTNKHTNG